MGDDAPKPEPQIFDPDVVFLGNMGNILDD
jgi:hypothetical protein